MSRVDEEQTRESKTPLVDVAGRRILPGQRLESRFGFRAKVLRVNNFTVVLDRGNFDSTILRVSIKGGGWRIVS